MLEFTVKLQNISKRAETDFEMKLCKMKIKKKKKIYLYIEKFLTSELFLLQIFALRKYDFALPWVCLRFVIVVFPDHTHLLFLL